MTMETAAGYQIARVATIPWEDRMNVDNWPSRAGMYYDDKPNQLCMRLIDYPVGSTEPRHVHAGTHATTVLKGRAIVDGVTLGPLDVIVGPSNEPHGPLHYPEGCKLLSAFQGSYYHSEVEKLATEKHYRLVQQSKLAWQNADEGVRVKSLVDHGCDRIIVQAMKFAAGAKLQPAKIPGLRAALVVEGSAQVAKVALGEWDFVFFGDGKRDTAVEFPDGATVLAVSLKDK
jgi:hypothetical protein